MSKITIEVDYINNKIAELEKDIEELDKNQPTTNSKEGIFIRMFQMAIESYKDILSHSIEVEEPKKVETSVVNDIRSKLQAKLLYLQGKKQIKGFGDVYFIPTAPELTDSLRRFWKKYPDYKDIDKITQILLNHIENCCKSGKFAPAVKYFIIKDGFGSPLAGGYEAFEELKQVEEFKSQQKFV